MTTATTDADDVAQIMNEAATEPTHRQWAIIWHRNDDGTFEASDEWVLTDDRPALAARERALPIGRTDWTGDDVHAQWADMLRDEHGPWTDLRVTTRRGEPAPRSELDRIVTAAVNAVRHRWHRNLSDRMVRVRLTAELDERDLQRWRVEWGVTGLDTIGASATVEELRNHFRWHLEQMVEVREPQVRP